MNGALCQWAYVTHPPSTKDECSPFFTNISANSAMSTWMTSLYGQRILRSTLNMFESSYKHYKMLVYTLTKTKTSLFNYEIAFSGHIISQNRIMADPSKVQKILDWPCPTNLKEVQQFLGLVKYLNAFLPQLVIQSSILSCLTTKECTKNFPVWNDTYQTAFDKIKEIVVSCECLTVIDHSKLDINKIFVTMDASNHCTSAVLSFGPSWETA